MVIQADVRNTADKPNNAIKRALARLALATDRRQSRGLTREVATLTRAAVRFRATLERNTPIDTGRLRRSVVVRVHGRGQVVCRWRTFYARWVNNKPNRSQKYIQRGMRLAVNEWNASPAGKVARLKFIPNSVRTQGRRGYMEARARLIWRD